MDAKVAAFLDKQSHLIDLQVEELHEQRHLIVSRLRWGRFSDRMKALLQVMTAILGAGIVLLIAAMAWQAHEAHGLVIESFSVSPDLARTGLTGQVAARRFLDRLEALQSATANSDRPPQSYDSDWGSEFKVEIPETGITFSEFDKLLRERLGNVSHVSGEIVAAPQGIAVTARMGDTPPQTFAGPVAAYDDLAQKAAEAIYRANQPYRYAEYLDLQGRWDEAFAVISDLATNGPPGERGWAYAKWAMMAINDRGDAAAARRLGARGMGYGPASDLNDYIAVAGAEVWSGHDQAALTLSEALYGLAQRRLPDTSDYFYEENKLLSRAWLNFIKPDYAASGADWMETARQTASGPFVPLAPAMAATAYALGHDLPAARRALVRAPAADAALAWDIAIGAFPALPGYWIAVETGRWPQALQEAQRMDRVLDAGKANRPIYGLMQQAWIWPLEALASARAGDPAAAEALIGETPTDCYLCVRVRGMIAAQQKDWPAAERWFATAVRQAPSLPFAYAERARERLDRGDARGALAVLDAADEKAPRFADLAELRGEALTADDPEGAASQFARAARLAANWGRNHLKWAEALARAGHRKDASVHLRTAAALELTPTERAELVALHF